MSFAAALDSAVPPVEHAFDGAQTLCGIPASAVTVYRHLFRPDRPAACAECRDRAAAAPTLPSGQERLHGEVAKADPGPMRDELLAALRQGARIAIWTEGPGMRLGQHYGRLDELVEGGAAASAAWSTNERIGIARVITDDWQFVVVLPEGGRPSIARAALDP